VANAIGDDTDIDGPPLPVPTTFSIRVQGALSTWRTP
jgi:hypothetical protein